MSLSNRDGVVSSLPGSDQLHGFIAAGEAFVYLWSLRQLNAAARRAASPRRLDAMVCELAFLFLSKAVHPDLTPGRPDHVDLGLVPVLIGSETVGVRKRGVWHAGRGLLCCYWTWHQQ